MFFWGMGKGTENMKKHDFFRPFFGGRGGDVVVNGGFCRDLFFGGVNKNPKHKSSNMFFLCGSNWNGME